MGTNRIAINLEQYPPSEFARFLSRYWTLRCSVEFGFVQIGVDQTKQTMDFHFLI